MTDPLPTPGAGPMPRWVWGVVAIATLLACGCWLLAVVLGNNMRAVEASHRPESLSALRQSVGRATSVSMSPSPEALMLNGPTETLPYNEREPSASVPEVPPVRAVPSDTLVLPVPVRQGEGVSASAAVSASHVEPLPVAPLPENPRYKANAVAVSPTAGPRMALMLDDMGGVMETSQRALDILPAGVTFSFFPWSSEGVALAYVARGQGHEIMIHVPMEPQPHGSLILDPGPGALKVGMAPAQIGKIMEQNLAPLEDIAVGVNNHMGSAFTQWEPGMRAVLTVLQREGMLFLDSKTAYPTATQEADKGLQLPVLYRNVFLDHDPTPEEVRKELERAVKLARKDGEVMVIGHPLPVTLDVLEKELPGVVSSGVALVPVTDLLRKQ